MKNTQHTPGPWKSWEPGMNKGTWAVGPHGKCPIVKTLGESPELNKANARLISSAPELLQAVEHVLIASEDNGSMNDIDWNLLRSVVAKAKGRP